MKLPRFVPALAVAVTAATAGAQPIPAATPEGIFCAGTYIAVGHVLDAVNAPDNAVDLKVEIADVLGARDVSSSYPAGRGLQRGDVVSIRIDPFASLIITATPRPPRPALSERQVRDTFVDKAFIFSVTMMASTFSASLWPASEKPWALDTMIREQGANCPRRL